MKLGVCYYPEHWAPVRWAEDARRMAAMGIEVVRIAEFAWSKIQPRPNEYDWAWLDQAIETLAGAGLKLVLGTPTAAPPRWLVNRYPDILARHLDGRIKGFGSRRHYCFSSADFYTASEEIVTQMARRYGNHPAVIAWQTDNEYGCHDTILSYSPSALRRFRTWLARRYGDITNLNEAWGNVFWSMDYARFDEIGFPGAGPADANPIHALDFRRFASDEVLRYNRMQVEILRQFSPGRDVLHNFMGFFGEFEHHELARDLDVASWDNYPLGFLDTQTFVPEDERLRWAHTGHPDISAFHHDLYRGLCHGRWWVMEQQAGPVNWAHANPAPLPGMVRAWTWEAFAHGAELVSYFRWRQVPFAQEQLHSGLHTPDDQLDLGGIEATQVAREIAKLGAQSPLPVAKAKVALIFDYTAHWVCSIQPHSKDFSYQGLVFAYYSALRALGLDIDIISASTPLDGYAMVVIPALAVIDPALVERLAQSSAQVVIGPRSGSKTPLFAIPPELPPGPLAKLLPMRVVRIESLRKSVQDSVFVANKAVGTYSVWRDLVEPEQSVEVLARFADQHPAVLRKGACTYFAGAFDATLLRTWLGDIANAAGLQTRTLAQGLRLRRRGTLQFAINYGPDSAQAPAPAGARFVLGSAELPVAGIAAWEVED